MKARDEKDRGYDKNEYARKEKEGVVLRKCYKIKGERDAGEKGGGRRNALADRERNSYCLASPAFPQYTAQVYRMCTPHPTVRRTRSRP